eukprot:gene22988-31295_t
MNLFIISCSLFISARYLKVSNSLRHFRLTKYNSLSTNKLVSSPSTTIRRNLSTKDDSAEKSSGHQVSGAATITKEEEELITKFRENQAKAARLSMGVEVRTLIDQSICYGTLSTNSVQYQNYPTGSIVGFELDDDGKPFFIFSTMSAHTKDIVQDEKASLTVLAKDFKGAAEGRVVIIGKIKKVDPSTETEAIAKLRTKYLSRHKDAYWIDFGDFSFFSMYEIVAVRYVGGFAMAGSISPGEYLASKPDPIAPFASPIMKHMNDDHADSTAAMVRHYAGVSCSEAKIVSIDSIGMTVQAKLDIGGGGFAKVRLPFPRPAVERKAIKEVLVEMTNAANSA